MRLNFKRLALLSGKAARACASLAELTPARIDLLTTVLRYERSQGEIARLLCVTDSVVSRMVKALVELGLVQRRIPHEDRRFRMISLTAFGLAQLDPVLGLPIPDNGSRGAQCTGEEAWLAYWKQPLARLGLDFTTLVESPEPPFWHLRVYNRADAYFPLFVPAGSERFAALP